MLFLLFPSAVSAQVVINEFQPKPNPEWVEFYNKSTDEVNLGNYFFDDDSDFGSDGGSSPKIGLQGILPSGGFCFWEMYSFLNDGGDNPTLFAGNGDILDTYSYASSSASFSYSRIPDGETWQISVSPSRIATSCLSLPTPTPVPTPVATTYPTTAPTPTPTLSPTATPAKTPTPVATKSPTPKSSPSPTPSSSPDQTPGVLGLEADSPTPEASDVEKIDRKPQILAIVFTSLGLILICLSIVYTVRSAKRGSQIS